MADLGPRSGEVYRSLRHRILSGELAVGTRLPAQSVLATGYGVSLMTVRQALEQLEAEGLVCVRPGRGTFVLPAAAQERTVPVELGAVIHASPLAIATFDHEGRITTWNAAAETLFGWREEEVIGGGHPAVPEEKRSEYGKYMSRALKGETVRSETRRRRKDGSWLDVEIAVAPIRDSNASVVGIMSIAADITSRKRAEEEVRESRELFGSAFQHAAVGMALVGLDGHWLQVNRALCAIVGYSEEELLSRSFQDITHPDDLSADLGYVEQMLAGEIETYQMEKRYIHRQGQVVWVLLSVSLVHSSDGGPAYFIAQMQDIHARKEAERALQEREQRFRTITETASDGIVTVDEGGLIAAVNPAAEALFGYRREELVGKPLTELMPEALRNLHLEGFTRYLKTGRRNIPWTNVQLIGLHRDGHQFALEMSFAEFRENGRRVFTGFMRDITERKRSESELVHLATHDQLTGLPNRSMLRDRLERAVRASRDEGTTSALLILDLDGFKEVNDSLGHHAGDALLQAIAGRLRASVRESDIVARLGGDEFAILLPSADNRGAVKVKRKIERSVGKPLTLDQTRVQVTASVGVALCPDDAADSSDLIRHADQDMYRVKQREKTAGPVPGPPT